MLTKEKALAIADSITAPAEAERIRQAERRGRHLVRLYPSLKAVPAAERRKLLQEAQVKATRHWSFILFAALVLLAVGSPFISRATDGAFPSIKVGMPLVPLAILGFFALNYLHVRRFLKAEVPNRFSTDASPNVTSDA